MQPAASAASADTPTAQGPASGPVTLLFVQAAAAGNVTPMPGTADQFTLTLRPASHHFTYFTDRPVHEAGLVPAATLLADWPFSQANPPNAALALQTASDVTRIVVLELTGTPTLAADGSVSYTVRIIPAGAAPGFDSLSSSLTADTLPPTFETASLFIDGSPIVVVNLGGTDLPVFISRRRPR